MKRRPEKSEKGGGGSRKTKSRRSGRQGRWEAVEVEVGDVEGGEVGGRRSARQEK